MAIAITRRKACSCSSQKLLRNVERGVCLRMEVFEKERVDERVLELVMDEGLMKDG